MRIGLRTPTLPGGGSANGIVTYVGIMRDALIDLGHEVVIFTADQYLTSDEQLCEIVGLSPLASRFRRLRSRFNPDPGDGGLGGVRLHRAASTLVRAGLVDVIEMEETFGWGSHMAGVNVPIVLRLHGPHFLGREPIETPRQRQISEQRCHAEGHALHAVAAVTSPSARLLQATRERYSFRTPARMIYNPLQTPSDTWSSRGSDRDQVLCVGRFDLRKGADLIVRAFAKALETNPDLRLVMVGPDSGVRTVDGNLQHFTEFVAANLSHSQSKRVSHLGIRSHDELQRLKQQSAFAVVASRFETFSYALMESMALGMPVITTDVFGTGEMVDDKKTGIVVPPNDITALADAISFMSKNGDTAQGLGTAARAWVKDNLNPAKIGSQTVAFYQSLLP